MAEHLELPYVLVANAFMLNMEPDVPPFSMGWGTGGPLVRLRNRVGNVLVRRLMQPIRDKLNTHRRALGLRPIRRVHERAVW